MFVCGDCYVSVEWLGYVLLCVHILSLSPWVDVVLYFIQAPFLMPGALPLAHAWSWRAVVLCVSLYIVVELPLRADSDSFLLLAAGVFFDMIFTLRASKSPCSRLELNAGVFACDTIPYVQLSVVSPLSVGGQK
jgi:hypothetical protein